MEVGATEMEETGTAAERPEKREEGRTEAPERIPRRGLFQWLSLGVLALWGAAGAAVVLAFLRPPAQGRSAASRFVDGGELASLREGTARRIAHQGVPIYIVRLEGEEIIALSGLCTHFQCVLNWEEASQTLVCPCHKGVFSPSGSVMAGLPNQPLARFPAHLRGGRILIRV